MFPAGTFLKLVVNQFCMKALTASRSPSLGRAAVAVKTKPILAADIIAVAWALSTHSTPCGIASNGRGILLSHPPFVSVSVTTTDRTKGRGWLRQPPSSPDNIIQKKLPPVKGGTLEHQVNHLL